MLTRPLFDTHPDALRDEVIHNRETLGRALDSLIGTLQEFRAILGAENDAAIEAVMVAAAEKYEQWVNNRHRADWDAASKMPDAKPTGTFMQGLLGGALTDRLFGDKDDDKK